MGREQDLILAVKNGDVTGVQKLVAKVKAAKTSECWMGEGRPSSESSGCRERERGGRKGVSRGSGEGERELSCVRAREGPLAVCLRQLT